jgi:Flp pilus assembly protein TadG
MNNLSLSQREAGVAMVEFAIVLPLMILILFGITELGRALYQENTLDKAVNTGTRYLARIPDIATFDDHTGSGTCTWAGTSTPEVAAAAAAAVEETQNLVAYGSDTTHTTPILPGLARENVVVNFIGDGSIDGSDEDYTTIAKNDGQVQICIIRVSVTVDFVGLFGDIVVPFTNLGRITLNAVAEERYIGL